MLRAGYAKRLGDEDQRHAAAARFDNSPSTPSWIMGHTLVDKTDTYWNAKLDLMDEFSNYTGSRSWRHDNEVDAFRHAYIAGLLSAAVGERAVNIFTGLTEDQAMDIANNAIGAALYRNVESEMHRAPTETEFALAVMEAIRDGKLVVDKPGQGQEGWLDRAIGELQDEVRSERDARDWEEFRAWTDSPVPESGWGGDALPPSDPAWERGRAELNDGYDRSGMDFGGGGLDPDDSEEILA